MSENNDEFTSVVNTNLENTITDITDTLTEGKSPLDPIERIGKESDVGIRKSKSQDDL
jgi:hypothetical protein